MAEWLRPSKTMSVFTGSDPARYKRKFLGLPTTGWEGEGIEWDRAEKSLFA